MPGTSPLNNSSTGTIVGSRSQTAKDEEASCHGRIESSSDRSSHQTKERAKIYPEKVNRVRAKKPKSRNGCITCKARRVKCDETKPDCLKCIKFGAECDGYSKPLKRAASVKRTLLAAQDCPLNITILPMTALFTGQEDFQYFRYFRDEISHDLSGHVPAKCWNYVVLQAGNDTPALRQLIVAIAALSKSKYSLGSSDAHHQFAVNRYGQALRGIQEMVSSRDDLEVVRTTLIASLLIFCFEAMHGNQEQAIEHAKASLNLMRKRLATSTRRYSNLRPLSSIPGLEDEILEVFVRLDSTIMSRLSGPHNPRASILDINFVDRDVYMPREFRDCHEAKAYLEHFHFRAMPYLSHLTDVFMYGDQFACPVPDGTYELLAMQLRQWYGSFWPLWERASRPGDNAFIRAATIRALALSTDISVQRVCLKNKDWAPDLFEAEARELIDLTRRVVTNHNFKGRFGFDCGVVPSLFIAIMICRNRSIREEAIRILRMAKGRIEIIWDAAMVADLGEKVLKADEQRQTVLPV